MAYTYIRLYREQPSESTSSGRAPIRPMRMPYMAHTYIGLYRNSLPNPLPAAGSCLQGCDREGTGRRTWGDRSTPAVGSEREVTEMRELEGPPVPRALW